MAKKQGAKPRNAVAKSNPPVLSSDLTNLLGGTPHEQKQDVPTGEFPPRILLSDGKNEGTMAGAAQKYGAIEQGELLIQDGDNWIKTHPRDRFILLEKLTKFFAGTRDQWTKQLEDASWDVSRGNRGGDMATQVAACLIYLPDGGVPIEERGEETPEPCVATFIHEKARTNGIATLLRAIRRMSQPGIENDSRFAHLENVPASLRVYGHMFGRVQDTKPDAKGHKYTYSKTAAKDKVSPPELVQEALVFLSSADGQDQVERCQSRFNEEMDLVEELANTPNDDSEVLSA